MKKRKSDFQSTVIKKTKPQGFIEIQIKIILPLIVNYIDLSTFARLLRVCKEFKHYIERHPWLWESYIYNKKKYREIKTSTTPREFVLTEKINNRLLGCLDIKIGFHLKSTLSKDDHTELLFHFILANATYSEVKYLVDQKASFSYNTRFNPFYNELLKAKPNEDILKLLIENDRSVLNALLETYDTIGSYQIRDMGDTWFRPPPLITAILNKNISNETIKFMIREKASLDYQADTSMEDHVSVYNPYVTCKIFRNDIEILECMESEAVDKNAPFIQGIDLKLETILKNWMLESKKVDYTKHMGMIEYIVKKTVCCVEERNENMEEEFRDIEVKCGSLFYYMIITKSFFRELIECLIERHLDINALRVIDKNNRKMDEMFRILIVNREFKIFSFILKKLDGGYIPDHSVIERTDFDDPLKIYCKKTLSVEMDVIKFFSNKSWTKELFCVASVFKGEVMYNKDRFTEIYKKIYFHPSAITQCRPLIFYAIEKKDLKVFKGVLEIEPWLHIETLIWISKRTQTATSLRMFEMLLKLFYGKKNKFIPEMMMTILNHVLFFVSMSYGNVYRDSVMKLLLYHGAELDSFCFDDILLEEGEEYNSSDNSFILYLKTKKGKYDIAFAKQMLSDYQVKFTSKNNDLLSYLFNRSKPRDTPIDLTFIKALVEKGCPVNTTYHGFATIGSLLRNYNSNPVPILKYLIEKKCLLESKYLFFVKNGYEWSKDVYSCLLESKCDVNAIYTKDDTLGIPIPEWTGIIHKVMCEKMDHNALSVIAFLLDSKADPMTTDSKMNTAFHMAFSYQPFEVISYLLSRYSILLSNKECLINKKGYNPFNLLYRNTELSQYKIFEINVTRPENEQDALYNLYLYSKNPLICKEIFIKLYEKYETLKSKVKFDCNTNSVLYEKLLHNVCLHSNRIDPVDFLLGKNFDLNSKNDKGETCLHMLFSKKKKYLSIEFLSGILQRGADPKATTGDDHTAFSLAVCSKYPSITIIKYMIDKGISYCHEKKHKSIVCGKKFGFNFNSKKFRTMDSSTFNLIREKVICIDGKG